LDHDAYIKQVRAVVQEKGWAIQSVYATTGTGSASMSYAYTIGLLERGSTAEVLISGLPVQLAALLLNEIAVNITENGGMPPAQWDVSGGKGEYLMLPLWYTRRSSKVSVNVAKRYYDLDSVPVVQYVWPAGNGAYPWDEHWPENSNQVIGDGSRHA
jgi:hypothetical protein